MMISQVRKRGSSQLIIFLGCVDIEIEGEEQGIDNDDSLDFDDAAEDGDNFADDDQAERG